MNKETTYLLKILKAFVCGSTPEPESEVDWKQLVRLANIHAVAGIVGYMLMKYPDGTDPDLAVYMRRQCLGSISLYMRRAERMKELIGRMDEAGIDHLLFKGYVLKDYYSVPELRTYGDIDFLIRPDDREKSHRLMLDLGFEIKTNWEPVYSYFRDDEFYEIHTDVMEVDVSDKADYKAYFKQIWDHARNIGGHTWELAPEFHFLYLLTHIAKHISGSGAGVRMYMDIAIFIRHFGNSIDWKYICGELEKLQFIDFANTVLTVVETYFGVESPISLKKMPEQTLVDFMDFTMEGGIFGRAGRNAGMIALKQEERNEENVSRMTTLIHRMFPSAATLESRYTYLKKNRWLLPVAWIHRVIITRGKWEEHTQEARSIISVDEDEVLRLKRIYKEIGL